MREKALADQLAEAEANKTAELNAAIAERTPIIHDRDKYYYPAVALLEPNLIPRVTVSVAGEMEYDEQTELFVNKKTEEKYLEVTNFEEFDKMRRSYLGLPCELSSNYLIYNSKAEASKARYPLRHRGFA